MGLISDVLPEVAAASIQAVTRGGPRRQYKWNKRAARDQNEMARANAEWMLEQNKRLLEEQRLYDSPAAQMARYKAAGLNPHLVYGSAGSSSSPIQVGGMSSANIQPPDASYPDVAGGFIQASQAAAQIGLNEARTVLSETQSAVNVWKAKIAEANPLLNPGVTDWLAKSMMATAEDKFNTNRSKWLLRTFVKSDKFDNAEYVFSSFGLQKMYKELELLEAELGLKDADQKVRNEILESKGFQNRILEKQADWIEDGDIGPEQIRQALMIMLSRWFR